MVLMIDNYDSFVYNLVQYLGEMGENIKVFRNDKISIRLIKKLKPHYIVISPGPCTPNEAGISLELIEHFKGLIPILGVCLGHQAIGQVFGGEIIKAEKPMHGKTSFITHDSNGLFKNLPKIIEVTRYHSLIVKKSTLPKCLVISAEAENGEIMGLRHYKYLIEGVQFHPEAILTKYGKNMLKNFLNYTKM